MSANTDIHPFSLAMSYVWHLSTSRQQEVTAQQQADAMTWIPLSALLLGVLLASIAWLFSSLPAEATAVVVMLLWVKLSGGATLEGLSTSVDAVFKANDAQGMREYFTASPKPAIGSIGISLLVLSLLLKWSLLVTVIEQEWWPVLVLMPVVGWSFGQMMFLGSRWVDNHLFKEGWREQVKLSWLWPQWLLLITALALASGWTLTMLVIGTWAWIVWWRKQMGGINGAIAYTWVEVSEIVWLLGLVMVLSSL
jgi:adenosylcobinamide-GDP ribazoletransferase